MKVIRLPNGRTVTLGGYVAAWRLALTMPPTATEAQPDDALFHLRRVCTRKTAHLNSERPETAPRLQPGHSGAERAAQAA